MSASKDLTKKVQHAYYLFGSDECDILRFNELLSRAFSEFDKARTPVADKALSLWLESGTPHFKGWLREQGAEVILQAAGPIKRGPEVNFYIGPFSVCESAEAVTLNIEFPSARYFNPSSIVSQAIYPLREECADAAQWLVMSGVGLGCGAGFSAGDWLQLGGHGAAHKPSWIIECARKRLVEFNAKRQPVADAAWFLLEYGAADWRNILHERSADHILYCAKARQETINAHREAIADAAQVLFAVFGRKADSFGYVDPVGTLNFLESEREKFADAASAFWMGAPAPDASVTMTRSLEQLVRDARYWLDARMIDRARDAIAISNGMLRPKASNRIRKIAALLLEEEAARESR